MKPVLLIDFGSTRTKITAVDVDSAALLGTASAATTVSTDIGDGLALALEQLTALTGPLKFAERFACSSAAGGLRMAACGLVPALTAEAARLASLGAGAKIVKTYSFQLTPEDIREIDGVSPDIFLLTGGTDGGNTACILHNAEMLAGCRQDFPILVAGNRTCAARCAELLAGRQVVCCENVMPEINRLNIEPVQEQIRALFLSRIISARGLSKMEEIVSGILMPTPSAVLRAVELLSGGTESQAGLGDLLAVDVGGATTDVYSVADGMPDSAGTVCKGLPEPRAKRTVEGDLGMRYGAAGVLEAVGARALSERSGLSEEQVAALTAELSARPERLPETDEAKALDFAIAGGAVETAMARHAGTLEQTWTPTGPVFLQTGKDLRRVSAMVVTGGPLIHSDRVADIAARAFADPANPMSLRPAAPAVLADRHYILAAMGLLSERYPDCALTLLRRGLEEAIPKHNTLTDKRGE